MPINEQQFSELEKRIASFKGLFGIFNSQTGKLIVNEQFGKSDNTFPENIISEPDKILSGITVSDSVDSEQNNIKPIRVRTWVTSSESDATTDGHKIVRGFFSSSNTEHTENPFVERIVMPLTLVDGTDGQFYVPLGAIESQSVSVGQNYIPAFQNTIDATGGYNGSEPQILYNQLAISQSGILKNFISPFKFGNGYRARVYQGTNGNINEPGINFTEVFEDGSQGEYEGWIFDYTEGYLFIGSSGEKQGDNSNPADSYTPYNQAISNIVTTRIGLANARYTTETSASDDGEVPLDNSTFHNNTTPSNAFTRPLWISAYRYIGPTGFSGTDLVITASKVQVEENLNIDGTLTFEGVQFASVDNINTSGSTVFGDEPAVDTHKFTGSVFITGGLFVDGVSTAGGGGGASPGIITSIFPNPSSSNEYGNFNKTTLFATDQNDVVEYKGDFGLKISSSIGSASLVILLGSESINEQIKTLPGNGQRGSTSYKVGDSTPVYRDFTTTLPIDPIGFIDNFNDLFRFTQSLDRDYPVLSSYAPFTASLNSFTTHSFEFTSSIVIPKIGIYYSRNTENIINSNGEYTGSIAGIKFEGSNDGENYTQLYEENDLVNKEQQNTDGRFITKSFTVGINPEFPALNEGPQNAIDSVLASGQTRLITRYTTNNFPIANNSYKFYRLYISGGAPSIIYPSPSDVTNKVVQWLHHIDIHKDLHLTGSNRKQININFDDDPHPSGLTNFQFTVSNSLSEAGLVSIQPADNAVILGTAQQNLDLNNNDLLRVDLLDSTRIENSGDITNEGSFTNTGDIISEGGLLLTASKGTSPNPPNGSIVLDSLKPIFFTNKKADGTSGVDQFSGRIFGHTTSQNVSDLYIDANRIYYISDAEHRIQTLDSEFGFVNISSSKIQLNASHITASGDISASGTIKAFAFVGDGSQLQNVGGAGSGFPHDQTFNIGTEITASITGSLIISGNNAINPHLILGQVTDVDTFTNNKNTSHILHNFNGSLFWGNSVIAGTTAASDTISNGILDGLLDISNFGITGSNTFISITGSITASGLLITSSNIDILGIHTSKTIGSIGGSELVNLISVELDDGTVVDNSDTANSVDIDNIADGTQNDDGPRFNFNKGPINIIINFGPERDTIVDHFRTFFGTDTINGDFGYLMPNFISVSASNDGVNYIPLAEGGRVETVEFTNNEVPIGTPSYNPLGIYGLGDSQRLRITQVPLTSQTQSFQYFKIRYSGSAELNPDFKDLTQIDELKIATRSFSTNESSIGFGNGTSFSDLFVGDLLGNVIGTSSYALEAISASYASNSSFSSFAVIASASLEPKLWKDVDGTYITSSVPIRIEGNISSSGDIILFNTTSLKSNNNILEIGSPLYEAIDIKSVGGTKLRISSSGNVGVGAINPTEQLVVGGNVNISGDISSSGDLYVKGLNSQDKDNIITYDQTDGRFYFTSKNNLINASGDDDWHITTTSLTSSRNISVEGNISASGFIYGLLPSQTADQPIVVYNNNRKTEDPATTGRLETSSLKIFNNIITSNLGTIQIGDSSINPTPADDGDGPIIFNPGGPVIFNNNIIRHRGFLVVTRSIEAGRAIIGISGSEKKGFNDKKLADFFTTPSDEKRRYSLYIRNGATIVGGDIIPDTPLEYDLGTNTFPFKELHLERGSIHFYSGSNATSGSVKNEIGNISVNSSSKEIEFKSGSNFIPIKTSEIKIGTDNTQSLVKTDLDNLKEGKPLTQINAIEGFTSIIRPESVMSPVSQRDYIKFTVSSRIGTFVSGTLFHDLRFSPNDGFNYATIGNGDTNIILNGHITSSGNISSSYISTASFGSLQLNNLPTSPTGLPTGSVWVSGSKNDATTNNVNCGTLMIVI